MTSSPLALERIRAYVRAAEAKRDRPAFIPPVTPASEAREVTLGRWRTLPGLSARGARVVLGREVL